MSPTLGGLYCRMVFVMYVLVCLWPNELKIELEGEGLWPECSIGEVEACMGATYFWFERSATNYQWQVAHKQYKYGLSSWWLSGLLQVRTIHIKTALINVRHPTHDFSVNLSLSMCSHSSCPDWRNVTACNFLIITFGDDLASYLCIKFGL